MILQWIQHGKVRPTKMDKSMEIPVGDCQASEALGTPVVFVGASETDEQGRWALEVEKIKCPDFPLLSKPAFIATPLSKEEIFLTAEAKLVNDKELVLSVRSWDLDGAAVPKASFSWLLRAYGLKKPQSSDADETAA